MRVNLKEKLKNNFIMMPKGASKILGDTSYRLLGYLIEVAGYDKPFTSYEKITKELGKSEKTILKSIKELRDLKVLTSSGTGIDTIWNIDFTPFLNDQNSKNEVQPPVKNTVRPPVKNTGQIRTNINKKEKEVKEKENSCFGYKYPTNKLTNDQIDSILRDLNLDDKIIEHPNDNEYYKIGGNLLGAGAISRMLSYIILNPKYKEKNIANLLNNPSNFSELARSM